ncbi:MAG: flagellar basal body rod protein FlgB [Acidobacteriota bacterium]|jgi:flagellar basal-body rod protein FlgB|nr:flagellar basal body protein [Bryobacteraceae bacterium CoA2 C42]MCA2966629.1 flagellar biosynthesis protein FlgB [Acidobacteriaceae bacterium]
MLDRIAASKEHYLNLLSARQKLVASNIANADTPGYRTKDIDFQREFLTLTHGAAPNVREVEGLPAGNDGNNVNIDQQARLLAENAIRFQFASMSIKGEFKDIKLALQEGRNG